MPTLAQCVGNADLFPVLRKWDYFNHAGVSPWASTVTAAVQKFVDTFSVDCFMSEPWFNLGDQVRSLVAKLINAYADEIVVMRNTSDGIAAVASAIDWKAGDVVVLPSAEYPSNVYPWMDAAERHGVKLVMVEERVQTDGSSRTDEQEIIDAARQHGARLIAVSHVQWATGQRMDLAKIGNYCQSSGTLLAVDVIQSAGAVPIDVRAMNIDFAFAGGHKWLMGPPGAGFLFVRRERTSALNSPLVGWMSVINPMDWSLKFTRRPDAGRFETGTHAFSALAGFKASLELLLDVGIENINAHVVKLGRLLEAGARAKGYQITTPQAEHRSGSLCFTGGPMNVDDTVKHLRANHRIEISTRMGRLRFAPHLYNTEEQVGRMVAALGQ
jgi:cysteine desulfurase / selenocysteine lyase